MDSRNEREGQGQGSEAPNLPDFRLLGRMFEANPHETVLFGLQHSQEREPALFGRVAWYNCYGDRLGSGDLDGDDLHEIVAGLRESEMIILVPHDHGRRDRIDRTALHGKCTALLVPQQVLLLSDIPTATLVQQRALGCVSVTSIDRGAAREFIEQSLARLSDGRR